MYKKILVGIDGSLHSENALNIAIELAKKYGSELLISNVYAIRPYSASPSPIYPPKIPSKLAKVRYEMLKRAGVKAEKAGVTSVNTRLSSYWGSEGLGLILEAEKEKCDLIILGTSGLTGFKRAMLGSVSEEVMRLAHCDVLITRLAGICSSCGERLEPEWRICPYCGQKIG